jgi:hypothetical protein
VPALFIFHSLLCGSHLYAIIIAKPSALFVPRPIAAGQRKDHHPFIRRDKMIYLSEKGTNKPLGTISEAQLQFLIDQLEEEWAEDNDYAISSMLLDLFEGEGADAELVSLLRNALGDRDEVNIVWKKSIP